MSRKLLSMLEELEERVALYSRDTALETITEIISYVKEKYVPSIGKYRYRCRLSHLPHTATKDDIHKVFEIFNYSCAICEDMRNVQIDHFFPISNFTIGHVAGNLLPLCAWHNQLKKNSDPLAWLIKFPSRYEVIIDTLIDFGATWLDTNSTIPYPQIKVLYDTTKSARARQPIESVKLLKREAILKWLSENQNHGLSVRKLAAQIRPDGYQISKSFWSQVIKEYKEGQK